MYVVPGLTLVSLYLIFAASADNGLFGISSTQFPISIAPGSSAPLAMTFTPQVIGSATSLVFVHIQRIEPNDHTALNGAGGTPTTMFFGNVAIGSTQTLTITMSNPGTASTTVSAGTVSGTGFSIVSPSFPLTLAAGTNQLDDFGAVVKDFRHAYGVEKSAVSDNFIEASREKLKELMERPLDELNLYAVLIDGTPFRDRQMIVALGISHDGRKTVLGLREGATENATVVGELLSDLAGRGLDFSVPRLYVLDGGKALAAAVLRHASEAAVIQRCQVHKRRNVVDHLAGRAQAGGEEESTPRW